MLRLRRHRNDYLARLAAEPLFAGVPRHLITSVGRVVDPLDVEAGTRTSCCPWRETIIITEGMALVSDGEGWPIAVTTAGGVVGRTRPEPPTTPDRAQLHAITTTRGFVIARRELRTLAEIAPRLAAALLKSEATAIVPQRRAQSTRHPT